METLNVALEHLGPIIAGILGTVLLALARGLMKKYGAKVDIETKSRLDTMVTNLTQQGVTFAEQWAKNRKKTGALIEGEQKLHKAMEFIAGQVRKYKLDELAEQELRERIESMLGYVTINELEALPIEQPEENNDEDMFD
jgi:hypothetical protein